MNPYHFVPLGPPAPRLPLATHDQFTGHSGILTCQLQTLTHFFVAGTQERGARRNQHQELTLLRENDAPIIPGSALKGAIRHIAEAISGSCLILPNPPGAQDRRDRQQDKLSYYDPEKKKREFYPLPTGFSPCGLGERSNPRRQSACPACRLFGYLSGNVLFMGTVSFETALMAGSYQIARIMLEPFDAPKPRHRSFYATEDSNFQNPRGRKFYYHRRDGARTTSQRQDFNKTVEAILPGATFEFTVHYHNLRDPDLALLIYALVLEEPMRHKMGMGKGVGLGSVQLTITSWQQIERQNRYQQLGGGITKLCGEALQNAISAQIAAYHQHYAAWQDSLAVLKDILTWDEQHPRDPRYPSRDWFKDHTAVSLEKVPEGAADYRRQPSRERPTPRVAAPRPERERELVRASQAAENLRRQFAKPDRTQQEHEQPAYQNGEVEKKATVVAGEAGKLYVTLPKLPEQRVALKPKLTFSQATPGARIRVRVAADSKGTVVRAEEI